MTGPADLSDDELVAHALAVHLLAGDDTEVYDGCVAELQLRGTPSILQRAIDLLADARPEARALGADVLGQLGVRAGTPYVDQVVPLLAPLVGSEADPLVVQALVGALGHQGDPRGLPAVLSAVDHHHPRVRFSVAVALPALARAGEGEGAISEGHPAVAALVALSTDADAEVRNWATFGLGAQLAADGPAVRAALRARLDDPDGDTAAEALAGLAQRREPGLVPRVEVALRAEAVGRLAVEAARDLAAPELRPALEGLVGWWDVDVDLLEAALQACAPSPAGTGRPPGAS